MLDLAKHQLRRILRALQDDIRAGTPIVVLEPSCASVFRDELLNLFPSNPDAVLLSRQTFLLGEFLAKFAADHEWPQLPSTAIVHGHCHQKSVLGMKEEESVLRALGLDYRILDSGCCGMAGAFGFEEDHYGVSVQVGEMRLLPAVRAAPDDSLIIADGFSCREQISQLAGRHALHLADVIHMAHSRALRGC
jgi:Fe-S oxidoreductase